MSRPVTIGFALNGFTAQVGCQTLVFNDLDELLGNLRSYLQDPEATEKAARNGSINAKITLGYQPIAANRCCPAGIDGALAGLAAPARQSDAYTRARMDEGNTANLVGYAASALPPNYPPPPVPVSQGAAEAPPPGY